MQGIALFDWDMISDAEIRSIPKHFDRVYLCVEDRHVPFRAENVIEMVDKLKSLNLEVVLNPWGVGNLFAGESISTVFGYVPWVELAHKTNADGIMLDEPKNADNVAYMVREARVHAPGKFIHLAIQPEKDPARFSKLVDEVSVSTYLFGSQIVPETTREDVEARVEKWSAFVPDGSSVWVQAWKVPQKAELVPVWLIKAWQARGINVNIWGWKACKTVSSIRPYNPERVWSNILNALP